MTILKSLGEHKLIAIYSGDEVYTTSFSPTVVLRIEPDIFPPKNLKGCHKVKKYSSSPPYDCVNILQWQSPARGMRVLYYDIYRDCHLKKWIARIPSDQKLKFKENLRRCEKGKIYTYFVVSVGEEGSQSSPACVQLRR